MAKPTKLVNRVHVRLRRGLVKVRNRAASAAVRRLSWLSLNTPLLASGRVCLKALTFRPIDQLTVPMWSGLLRATNHREANVDWLQWAAVKYPRPRYSIELAKALIEAGQIDRVEPLVAGVKSGVRSAFARQSPVSELDSLAIAAKLDGIGAGSVLATATLGDGHAFEVFYRRLWRAHGMEDRAGVEKYTIMACEACNHDPATVLHIIDNILVPNGEWPLIKRLIGEVEPLAAAKTFAEERAMSVGADTMPFSSGLDDRDGPTLRQKRIFRSRLCVLKQQMIAETGNAEDLLGLATSNFDEIGDGNFEGLYWAGMSAKRVHDLPQAKLLFETYIRLALRHEGRRIDQAFFQIAQVHELMRDFAGADLYYRRHVQTGGIPFYLPVPVWDYCSYLMALGRWDDCGHLLTRGLLKIWEGYHMLARTPITKRIRSCGLVPAGGAFYLGCRGIGDETIRLAILAASRAKGARYGMTIDPRLLPLAKRSLPDMEFIANSRTFGPFAVSAGEYLHDREGVPDGLDSGRVTREVLTTLRRYRDVGLTEDLFLHFVQQKGTFRNSPAKPMLTTDPALLEAAQGWLATLPGRVKVGLSWRSGVRDILRNESYFDASELGPLLALKNVDFISLQYSDTRDEEREMLERFGCRLHKMPGVDLRDDIDKMAALSLACDVVIAPCTAARELAGAVGARTISLTTTPVLPDLWRTAEDRETDVIFPSISHVTLFKHGSKQAVMEEVARRVAAIRDARAPTIEVRREAAGVLH